MFVLKVAVRVEGLLAWGFLLEGFDPA